MNGHSCSILLYGHNSGFFDYACFHLAAHGIRTIPILSAETLAEALRSEKPSLVLLHWDTLGEEDALRSCAYLKACHESSRAPVAIVSEKLRGGVDIMSAFSSGADDLIEGAINPRIFWPRVKSLLGRRAPTVSAGF